MTGQGRPATRQYDFHKPAQISADIQRPLREWQERICRLLPASLLSILGSEVGLSPSAPAPARANDLTFDAKLIALPLKIEHAPPCTTYLVFPRPLMITLVQTAFGDNSATPVADRPLTELEQTVAELICQQMGRAVHEVRPALLTGTGSIDEVNYDPQLVRLLPGNPELVVLNFELKTATQTYTFPWLWRQADAERLFGAADRRSVPSDDEQAQMEAIVRQLPVEVVIQLGTATLNLADLAALEVGDVIVLNQRIHEPLQGVVADQPLLHAWPGRLGNKQAIQIDRIG